MTTSCREAYGPGWIFARFLSLSIFSSVFHYAKTRNVNLHFATFRCFLPIKSLSQNCIFKRIFHVTKRAQEIWAVISPFICVRDSQVIPLLRPRIQTWKFEFLKKMNDRCPCVKKRASSCKSEQLVYAYADCGQSTRSPARRISRRPAHAIGLLKDACACEIFLETQGHFVELLKLFVTPFLSEVAFQAWHSAEHLQTKKLSRLENVPFRRVLLPLWSEWSLYALDLRSFPTIWRDFESQA